MYFSDFQKENGILVHCVNEESKLFWFDNEHPFTTIDDCGPLVITPFDDNAEWLIHIAYLHLMKKEDENGVALPDSRLYEYERFGFDHLPGNPQFMEFRPCKILIYQTIGKNQK